MERVQHQALHIELRPLCSALQSTCETCATGDQHNCEQAWPDKSCWPDPHISATVTNHLHEETQN